MPRRQRGAAALLVTLLLFLVLALALMFASRALLVDGRTSRNQIQAAQAFEAAEAGVEWTTALLNDPRRIDDDCRVTPLTSAVSLRDRLLDVDATTGKYRPREWNDSGVAQPIETACAKSDAGWRCNCPSTGLPHPPTAIGRTTQPSFRVSLQAGSRPGTVQVTAIGCNNTGPACLPGSGNPLEARAQVQVLLALLPGLFVPPAAALTAAGNVASTGTTLRFSNTDPASGGTTVDAGGTFAAPGARLHSAPGALVTLSLVEADAALRVLPAERLFARHFGLDKPTWRQRPDVTRIACEASCASQISAALADGTSLLWVDGDLVVEAAADWGTSDKPVIIVTTGEVRISAPVVIHGLLYSRSIIWNEAGSASSSLRGAVISEGNYSGDGSPDVVRDVSVLRTLNLLTGSFVRVSGGWKDF